MIELTLYHTLFIAMDYALNNIIQPTLFNTPCIAMNYALNIYI